MKSAIFTLAVILFIGGFACAQDKPVDYGNPTLNTIHSRKSVRNFTGEAVSKEDLQKIVEAGMCAPTAMNRQPWSFVIVTDREMLNKLLEALPSKKMLAKAGAAIIICALPDKSSKEMSVIDCSLAGENMLLAIESLGLGGLWTAAYPDENMMSSLRTVLGIPDNVIPMNVMPIGHPDGSDKPKDKYKEENVHWDKW
jgi:nitroreductase